MNSLRVRLFAAIGLIVVLSIGVTLAVAIPLTRREAQRSTLADVARQADLIAENRRQSVAGLLNLGPLRRQLADQDERLLVAPLDRPSRYLSAADLAALRRNRPVDGSSQGSYRSARNVQGKALILLRPKRFPSKPYVEALALGGLAGAALAAIAALLLARALARPIRQVAEASRRLGADLVPEHVPETGATELRMLARSFNEMTEQLRKARDAERSFLLSASHELKTPLTAIRGYAEALDEGVVSVEDAVATIRLEAARLERLVRDLLDLARMNKAEFSFQLEVIDLGEVAGEVVRRYEQEARAFGVTLESETNGSAPARADAGSRPAGDVEPRGERATARTGGRRRPRRVRARRAARRGHGPRSRPRGAEPCVRALLPLRALRQGAPRRHGARARDREAAGRGDGGLRVGRERPRPAHAFHGPPAEGTLYVGLTAGELRPDRSG